MTILRSDPQVHDVPVYDEGEPMVLLDGSFGPAYAAVRASVAQRLLLARDRLPAEIGLRVVEGHRSTADQQAIFDGYTAQLSRLYPDLAGDELERLTGRFVAPISVAPHVAGAAVDLTLVHDGRVLDLGTPIGATPEASDGACFFDAAQVTGRARKNRALLASVLEGVGLVNHPTEWWHWSYGDRYWALSTGAPAALYGPVSARLVLA
jgi:D-alanyl-D-alanine dipeptidase